MYFHTELVERHLGIKTSVFTKCAAIIFPIAVHIFISSEIYVVKRKAVARLPRQYRMDN